jgi:hypothetical protein
VFTPQQTGEKNSPLRTLTKFTNLQGNLQKPKNLGLNFNAAAAI